ncbi:MAG: nodulation protein NfeD [Anaerolineales bacterium]|nr:nodulation protein NfeD [Anaerolineales bacterium]
MQKCGKHLNNLVILLSITFILIISTVSPVAGNTQFQPIIVLDVDGVINPFTARYLDRGLEIAWQKNASLVVLLLDTPGGLESSMREMVQSILQSPIPIVVFVEPQGARATSAGLFILMAGDIAAMAPATNVGAATPVAFGGEIDEVMSEKALSDASAFVRSLAEKRDRNVEWVQAAVQNSLSLTSFEALDEGVIEIVAEDLDDLLAQVDGQVINNVQFDLSSSDLQFENMNLVERFYHTINEPNIAYLLLSLGTLFLLTELSDPGLSVAGIGAVLFYILGFMALGTLPVNWAAVGMLTLSLLLFTVALLTDTEVILTIAGLVPFFLGSLLLFTPFQPESPALPELRVSLWLIIFMAGLIVFFSLIILRAILKASKLPPKSGAESLIGKTAMVTTNLDPNGRVEIDHQNWSATSVEGNIEEGQHVRVQSVSGVSLMVTPEKVADSPSVYKE